MKTFDCKYYLPCGMCELKKALCTYFTPIPAAPTPIEPSPIDPWKNMNVSVYACPAGTTTTWQACADGPRFQIKEG